MDSTISLEHTDTLRGLRAREIDLVMRLCHSDAPSAYWTSSSLEFPAPVCGIVRADTHTVGQRVAVLQFTLFNWVCAEGRSRYFPRRTQDTNLWTAPGDTPKYSGDVLLPGLAPTGQLYDLIPSTAIEANQMAVRCQRPDTAVSAAAANRARREQELVLETERAVKAQQHAAAALVAASSTTPAIATPKDTHAAPAPLAPRTPRTPPTPDSSAIPEPVQRHQTEDQRLCLNPLRFSLPGPPVVLGHASSAVDPAPGSGRFSASTSPSHTVSSLASSLGTDPGFPSWVHTIPGGLGGSLPSLYNGSLPSSYGSSLSSIYSSSPARGPGGNLLGGFGRFATTPTPTIKDHSPVGLGLDGLGSLDLSFGKIDLVGATEASSLTSGLRDGDWVCPCGTHNFSARTFCVRTDCRFSRATTETPPVQTATQSNAVQLRSALGDPGDWYCDFCGLCNWTRRTFCLRCCPLHPDNIEEAITKGLVSHDDPIINILGYGDKRARALKKGRSGPATHCACFGPHHGTRCPNAGRGITDDLWRLYLDSQVPVMNSAPPPPSREREREREREHSQHRDNGRQHREHEREQRPPTLKLAATALAPTKVPASASSTPATPVGTPVRASARNHHHHGRRRRS